ncbi:hypothetical protein LPJ57_003548 [Coemansia sp. RSA 486]|nr:hypothetical protein LPJ57_003548 [Coemansia sp. RSA 486]KAJ2602008.1 hypothetical protein GGF39_000955 [Coemansia sp. RSA 1721]
MGAPYSNYRASMALCIAMAAVACAYPMADMGSKAGDVCKPRTIFCADGDGLSSRYLKCIQGKLVEEFCPEDSTCIGSKDTTIFCAVEASANSTVTSTDKMASTNSISTLSSGLLLTQSTTTTMVVHVAFDPTSSWSSPVRMLPEPTHEPIRASSANSAVGSNNAIHPSTAPPNNAMLLQPFSQTRASSSLQLHISAAAQAPRPQLIPATATHRQILASEQSRYPQHHHFSINPQQLPQSLQRPTPVNLQQTPHPSAQSYWPHHMLSLPPALSYNRQKLPVVNTALVQHRTPNASATRPLHGALPAAALPYNPDRSRDAMKMLNTQIHEASPAPTGESDPDLAPEDAADKIDDISVDQALSVIGSVLISQRVDSMTDSVDGADALTTDDGNIASQDQDSVGINSNSDSNIDSDSNNNSDIVDRPAAESTADVTAAAEELTSSQIELAQPSTQLLTPLSTPAVCTPGQFVCEAHGLRPGYFACDSAGVALPAMCSTKEVCYQLERSILCAAPGGPPKKH